MSRVRVGQIIGALVLSILALNVGLYYEIGRKASEAPPLTAGLTSKDGADVNALFLERLHGSFAIGSSATAFTASLVGQGFQSSNWGLNAGQAGTAIHDDSNWLCGQGATVRWSVDSAGRLATLDGSYREQGCLWSRAAAPIR